MLEKVKAVAFDLDGTIYCGNSLINGSLELISFLKNLGIQVLYFTNNSSRSRKQIYEKLRNLGIELEFNTIYSSAYSTAVYASNNSINNVFCIGSEGLKDELKLHNINIVGPDSAEALIIGLDVDFNYEKLSIASHLMMNGCKTVSCNKDPNYPVENGKFLPGCGAIVTAIEKAAERKIDYSVGKPNTFTIELIAKDWNLNNNEILVVGDTYSSDIEMAKRFKCPSILISNNYDKNDTILVKNLSEIINLFGSDGCVTKND